MDEEYAKQYWEWVEAVNEEWFDNFPDLDDTED
jgi:hypothetical protein